MIDLHMHTTWSDGLLIPAEMAQRARVKGLKAIALTDHVDHSNLEPVVTALVRFCEQTRRLIDLPVLPGCELTHLPPEAIADLVQRARKLGAKWVVVHGESPVEPVPPGTNRAAIIAGADLLAHPGLITEAEVKLAVQNGVALELTARKGHSLANGRVAALGKKHGAILILNTDAHAPEDLIDDEFARVVALGAGLVAADFKKMQANSRALVAAALKRRWP